MALCMSIRKTILISTVLLLFAGKVFCVDGLKIEINAPQWGNQRLQLVSYYNDGRYTQDTLRLSASGTGVFRSDLRYPEGLYMIYLDSVRFFDLLLADDQTFSVTVDPADFISGNRVEGSVQTEAFLSYSRFLAGAHRERTGLFNEFNRLKTEGKNTEEVTARMDSLNNRVIAFQDTFFETCGDQWVARFFKGLSPAAPGPYPAPRTMEEAIEESLYRKYHFFDPIDLQDPRFWYTNYFPKKIEQYITGVVEQIPDSIAKAASWLVEQAMGDSICGRMMLGKLMNYALSNDMMGLENVWARLAEDYYFKELVYTPDSVFLERLKADYRNIRNNRIGMQGQNLTLQDNTGREIQLYDLTGKLTLLYFFEPDCGFCKKTTPRLYEVYMKYKDKGLSVACICTTNHRKEWLNFIDEQGLSDWYNLWDPEFVSAFWQYYDTSTTPGVYVLDESHRIIAKKLDVDSLDRLFSMILK